MQTRLHLVKVPDPVLFNISRVGGRLGAGRFRQYHDGSVVGEDRPSLLLGTLLMALTRVELQSLADRRIADAKVLLDGGRFDAAYYVAGYAVECGLKACIANLLKTEVFPEKGFASTVYIHDLRKLIDFAGLKSRFDTDTAANATLFGYWGTVLAWSEHSRYDNKDEVAARELYNAITDASSGVLPWIKLHW